MHILVSASSPAEEATGRDAMSETIDLETLRAENAQLKQALESRIVIEQAKGILAERLHLEIDDAFALLRYAARSTHTRIHELAAQVVASHTSPPAITIAIGREQRWLPAAKHKRDDAIHERAPRQQPPV